MVKVLAENYWQNSRVGNIEIYLLNPSSSSPSLLTTLLEDHLIAFVDMEQSDFVLHTVAKVLEPKIKSVQIYHQSP